MVIDPAKIRRSKSIQIFKNNLLYHINMGFNPDENIVYVSWKQNDIDDLNGFDFIKNKYNTDLISFTSQFFEPTSDFNQVNFDTTTEYEITNPIYWEPVVKKYE